MVSLKEGRHLVRFYLPPEIVERDSVRNEVHSFLIRLTRSGTVVEEQVSRELDKLVVANSTEARFAAFPIRVRRRM